MIVTGNDVMSEPASGTLGPYGLIEPLGAGSLGEVFRARDTVHGRTVAITRLSPSIAGDPARMAALREAADQAAAISHPGVAMLYECGAEGEAAYLAQEFAAGQSLKALLGGRAIHPRRAVELALEIADALGALHAAGIRHGDLRPDTVLVTQKGHVKLLDAGLAAFTGPGSTRAGAPGQLGSLPPGSATIVRYLAPEEALGEGGDARSDLFALGLLLFEMLTGEAAFDRPRADDALLAVVRDAAPVPSARSANLPPALDRIVARALSKPVDRRYQSAAGIAVELRAVKSALDAEAVPAAPIFERAADRPGSRLVWWIAAAAAAGAALMWTALR